MVLKFVSNEFWGNNEDGKMRCMRINLFVIWKIPFPVDTWNLKDDVVGLKKNLRHHI